MTDKSQHKRMTAKECQAAKEQRSAELAITIANLPKYTPKTAQEHRETNERYKNALVTIGNEIERLETIERLNKLYQN